ncbi:MAG: acyltransferase [Verrucomicrobiales bacterium]|nr:acyltransferase [Verrucomicrobiales bacterium]
MSNRIQGVDEAKGIAILLVVVGHVWLGLYSSGVCKETKLFVWVIDWIYSFHMPVFFVIAGMLAIRSVQKYGGPEFVGSKLRTVVFPYLVWSVLQLILQRAFQSNVNAETSSSFVTLFVAPIGQFWFLYTLFVLYLVHLVSDRLGMPAWAFLLVTCGPYVFVRGSFWPWEVLQGVAAYGVFYALGACCLKWGDNKAGWEKLPVWAGGVALGGVALAVTYGWQKPLWGKLIVAVIGSGGVLVFGCWLGRVRWGKPIQVLGQASLAIFVAHTIFAAGLRTVLIKFGLWQPEIHFPLGVLVGILGPLVLLAIERWCGFPYFFTWPSRPHSPRP